jgi:quinol monooxygenase YgiN
MVEQAATKKDKSYINVIATVEVKDGKRDEYLQIFKALVPKVRAEEGCYEYGATVDMESALTHITGAPRTNTVVIIEKWASIEALQAHIGQPHMKEFK